ncbi:MAG: YlxR family protein [Dermatophilaceae bacterium]
MVQTDRLRRIRQRPTRRTARTCVGCRRRDDRSALLRVVAEWDDTGEHVARVVADPRLRLPGRGAWLHPTLECLDLALRRKALGRALRVKARLELASVSAYIEAREQSVVIAVGSIPELAVQQVPESESGFDADEHPMSTHR